MPNKAFGPVSALQISSPSAPKIKPKIYHTKTECMRNKNKEYFENER